MNSKKTLVIIISILLVVALFTMSFLTLNRINSLKISSDDEVKLLSAHYLNQLYYSISDGATILDNDLFKEYKQNNNLIGTPVLVICYSNFSCDSCMDYLIDKLRATFPDYENNKQIVFIAKDYKATPLKLWGNTIVLRNGDELGMECEDLNEPFLFIENNGYVFHVFIPNSKLDPFFDNYLDLIEDKYFSE